MLLRIDVYPHNARFSMDDTDADGVPVSPVPPLYACMGTAKGDDGQLLTVGRKGTDIVLVDKSVSRNHLTVSLVSTGEAIEDRNVPKPRTPEEEKACEDDGMCVVITDSSRFGSFLVKEGNNAAPNDDDDDATGGEETEDESQKPNAQGDVSLSLISAKLTSSSSKLEKLDPKSPLVLSGKERILIQCGQNGSTILIRPVPLRLVWSRLDASTKALWTKRLPALGATSLAVADETMTHLVSNERIANSKHLAAWYLQKPFVTTEYLQALWDRKSPTDPMPQESNVETTGSKSSFWKDMPNVKLWSGCEMLCLVHDDMACLCQAAGATVIPLYNLSEKDALQRIKEMESLENAFYISTTVTKVARHVRHLKKHNVHCVTQRSIANAAAKQTALKDVEGKLIGPAAAAGETADNAAAAADHHPEEHGESEPQCSEMLVVPHEEAEQEPLPPIETIPEESREEQPSVEEGDVEPPASSRKRPSSSQEESTTSQEEPPKQRRKTQAAESEPTGKKRSREEDEPSLDADDEPPTQRRKLEVSSDGWLVIAPSNRKAYRRPREQDEEPLAAPADTVKRSNLVVGPSSVARKQQSTTSRGGRDFKKFRKNLVSRGSMSRIALRSCLPKESEVEKELDERQRALEEEQRAADALFRDPSSGIRSHFKPKRKRARG